MTISDGRITSLLDVAIGYGVLPPLGVSFPDIPLPRRELIPEGSTGGMVVFEDRPNYWDAWGALKNPKSTFSSPISPDVEIHHLEKRTPLEFSDISVVAQGPLRASVKAEVRYGQSRISVTVRA